MAKIKNRNKPAHASVPARQALTAPADVGKPIHAPERKLAVENEIVADWPGFNRRDVLFISLFSLLTMALCLGASGLAGRSLWCDEILRLFGQRLSVEQLLRFEHLRTFCTQTPTAYLFMRPWQILFNPVTGGFLLTALSAGVVTAAVLATAVRLLRVRPHFLAALIVATNPLVVYYGSEIAFYILWAAAGACAFAILAVQFIRPPDSRMRIWESVALAAAASAFVTFHFAGIFVWGGIGLAMLAEAWLSGGIRAGLRRLPMVLIPILVNVPMYIGAMRAPEHIGTRTLRVENLTTVLPELWRYGIGIAPVLTGGWWIGIGLFLFGAWRMLRAEDRAQRRVLLLALAMTAAVGIFLAYIHLRDYMPHGARYWVYAATPVLTVLALGLHEMLSHRRALTIRTLGWIFGGAVLLGNAFAGAALISEEGRPAPYRRLQEYIAGLPPARQVISPNQYENRFFGGYYPMPNRGRLMSPCFWEEGREARIRGLRSIWALVPDAVCFVMGDIMEDEVREAGVVSFDYGYRYTWPWFLRVVARLRVYPEPQNLHLRRSVVGLFHATREALAAAADVSGTPVVLPLPGWDLVQFRDMSGNMAFGLLAPAGQSAGFALYRPAGHDGDLVLELHLATYHSARLRVEIGGRRTTALMVPATEARSVYIRQQQSFNGLPPAEYLLSAGDQFAMSLQPQIVSLELNEIPAGWTDLRLHYGAETPLLVLAHTARAAPRAMVDH